MVAGKFNQFLTPCEDLFTNEEWSDILKRFDTKDIGDEDEVSIEELEVMYGDKLEDTSGNKSYKDGRRSKRILPRSKKKDKYKSSDEVDLTIIQTNCDGVTSKQESFEDILKEKSPDVVLIQKTALKEKRKIKSGLFFLL